MRHLSGKKYQLMALGTVVLMLCGILLLQHWDPPRNRYHQHLEARPYTPCTDHGPEVFCTHLPLLSIETDEPVPDPFLRGPDGLPLQNKKGMTLRNNQRVGATVTFFDAQEHNNHLTDPPTLQERALFRIRGASSRLYDKKGYSIQFCTPDLSAPLKLSLCGMTADEDWVLHGPFIDKTLIRNYLCYNLAGEMMEYAPNVRFCELFLNQDYQGLYVLTEKISYNSDGRIQLHKTNPSLAQTSFICLVDRAETDPLHQLEPFSVYADINKTKGALVGQYEVVYPGSTLTEEQRLYIERYISRMEKAIYSFDYRDPSRGYAKYLDTDSFVNYYLFSEFTSNYDALDLSTFFYKDTRGLVKLVVWDCNSTFFYNLRTFNESRSLWYWFLLKDPRFVEQVIQRYRELRESYLSEEYLLTYIDQVISYLGPAIDRNYQVWGYLFEDSSRFNTLGEEEPRSHAEAVSQLKEAIRVRGNFMDQTIDKLQFLCHPSMNKRYNYFKTS